MTAGPGSGEVWLGEGGRSFPVRIKSTQLRAGRMSEYPAWACCARPCHSGRNGTRKRGPEEVGVREICIRKVDAAKAEVVSDIGARQI